MVRQISIMLVHDLECPNCGASVHFGNNPRATCAYCHSALSLAGGSARPATERAESAPSTAAPAHPLFKTARSLSARSWLRAGCVLVVVSQLFFVCVCGGFVALANTLVLKTWGPLDQVAALVQQQPQVARALGEPITLGAPTSSSFQSKNGTTTVKFDAPVIGAAAKGKVHVEGRWLEDGWDLDVWITYPTATGEQQVLIQRQGVR